MFRYFWKSFFKFETLQRLKGRTFYYPVLTGKAKRMNVILNEPSTYLTSLLSVRMHANFVALGPIPIAVAVLKGHFSKLLNSVRF